MKENSPPPYSKEFYLKAFRSGHERVAIWGAYQLLRHFSLQDEIKELIESSIPGVQEAGLAYMAEEGDDRFLSEVVGIFRESEGQLKHAAAHCLAQFPNDFSKNLIQRWFEQVKGDEHATPMELQAATATFLQAAPQQGFERLLEDREVALEHIILGSAYFQFLLPLARTEKDINACMDFYFQLRDRYSDTEVTGQLMNVFGHEEVAEWLDQSLTGSYSLKSIYEQCFLLFERNISLDLREIWRTLEEEALKFSRGGMPSPKNVKILLRQLELWINRLVKEEPESSMQLKRLWLVQAFILHQDEMMEGIPRIMEMETGLLLSIPLAIALETSFTRWVKNPNRHLSVIANYYHSPLLTQSYCEDLLEMFFPHLPQWEAKDLVITKQMNEFRPDLSRPEILWALFRGELLGVEVDWPRLFPNPYTFEHLPTLLLEIYLANFDYYLKKGDLVAIDYALQLFQEFGDPRIHQLCLDYFEPLVNHHVEMFSQLIEYQPHPDLLPLLIERFEGGEKELGRTIEFISIIFELEVAEEVTQALVKSLENKEGPKRSLRIHCPACKTSFPYYAEKIYLDIGALQRTKHLTSQGIWVEESFSCKKCGESLPLELDLLQLEELARQSRIESLFNLKLGGMPSPLGHRICLIEFPRFQGESYSPRVFEALVEQIQKEKSLPLGETKWVLMKLAKMYRAMGRWSEMLEVLEGFGPLHSQEVEWNFFMGQGYFKQGDFNQARPYFEKLGRNHKHMPAESPEYPYLEKARYWLKSLDSYSVKRARFQLFQGKKE